MTLHAGHPVSRISPRSPGPDGEQIITLAALAVGGQGGGVLTKWIVEVAEENGWHAQSTSVAGVAQRIGATIYDVEMCRDTGRQPVFALSPAQGDMDILMASEMIESGRVAMRGFVTPGRTTLRGFARADDCATPPAPVVEVRALPALAVPARLERAWHEMQATCAPCRPRCSRWRVWACKRSWIIRISPMAATIWTWSNRSAPAITRLGT